jgi:hypothetical protein
LIEDPAIIEKILRHLKLWNPPTRPPPPRPSLTLEPDADFLAWEAVGRLFDGIDRGVRHVALRVMPEQNRAVMTKVCPDEDGRRVRGSVPRTPWTLHLTLCADWLFPPRQIPLRDLPGGTIPGDLHRKRAYHAPARTKAAKANYYPSQPHRKSRDYVAPRLFQIKVMVVLEKFYTLKAMSKTCSRRSGERRLSIFLSMDFML